MAPIRKSASRGPASAEVTGIYEPDTGSIQYIAACPQTGNLAGLGQQHDGCRRFGHLAALEGRVALARTEINHVFHDRD